jgi:hypothetical protein
MRRRRESDPCPKFGLSGLLGMIAWAQKGHWLPDNDKSLGISSQKIAAFSSTISQRWRRSDRHKCRCSACQDLLPGASETSVLTQWVIASAEKLHKISIALRVKRLGLSE